MIPIFPELRPYLEAVWDEAEPGTEFVITGCRDSRHQSANETNPDRRAGRFEALAEVVSELAIHT